MYKRQNRIHKGLGIIRRDKNSFSSAVFSLSGEFPVHVPPIKRGKGPFLYDYDENRYVDFELSKGSLLLGHAYTPIYSTMKSYISRGYAGGLPVGAQDMLAGRISDLAGCTKDGRWLFFLSEYEAAAALRYILRRYCRREKGIMLGGDGTEGDRFYPFWDIESMMPGPGRDEGLREDDWDFVVLREGRRPDRERMLKAVNRVRKEGGVVVSDEIDLARHVRMRTGAGAYREADVRVFGRYLSSGAPFGCIFFSKKVESRLRGKPCYNTFTDIASFSYSVPLYALKSATSSLSLLEKEGGMEALLSRQQLFFRLLDDRFFEQDAGLVYLKAGMIKRRYSGLRLDLLKRGVYLPLSVHDPLVVSFAHTDELLKKCAGVMSSSVQDHVSGINEGQR